jgi:5,10-methylenetetrahydromethanopterin reductase
VTPEISCAFPPVPETPAHIELAEQLGYAKAWVYDTPALQLDCWMTLALAATRTTRITLGPGVLIPSLRHPMVAASALAHLVQLAGPERVVVGIGSEFTGRRALGQKPLRWADMAGHVETLRELLRGDVVEVEGRATRMLHWPGQAPARPIDLPFVIAVNGPRGQAIAQELGCGVFTSRPRPGTSWDGAPSVTLLGFGTVLDEGESAASPRVIAAVGPQLAVAYHAFLEQHDARLDTLPNAARFVELAGALPEAERHLHLHEGHLTNLNDIDRQVMTPELVAAAPLLGSPDQVRRKLEALAATGITEVAYQPAGDDLERELRTFAAAAGIG